MGIVIYNDNLYIYLFYFFRSEKQGKRTFVRDHLEATPESFELSPNRFIQQKICIKVNKVFFVLLRDVRLIAVLQKIVK